MCMGLMYGPLRSESDASRGSAPARLEGRTLMRRCREGSREGSACASFFLALGRRGGERHSERAGFDTLDVPLPALYRYAYRLPLRSNVHYKPRESVVRDTREHSVRPGPYLMAITWYDQRADGTLSNL